MNNAIAFAKWIADRVNENDVDAGSMFAFTLLDGNWYWEDDKDGDQPLTEEYLYKLFLEETKNKSAEPICEQTGITCGYPCWHKCPRYDEDKSKNFNHPTQCEQAAVMRSLPLTETPEYLKGWEDGIAYERNVNLNGNDA